MRKIILLVILVIAFALRVFSIDSNPPIFVSKEALIGATADIWRKGDFYTHSLKIVAPLAVAATMPFVKNFGWEMYSTRLPSVIFGVLTVFIFYFVAQEIGKKFEKEFPFALLCTAALALSPWHIQVSRIDTGINLGLMFFLLGIWSILKSRDNPKLFYCWTIPFVLSVYSDYSYFFPAILGLSFAVYQLRGWVRKYQPAIQVAIGIGIISILPVLSQSFSFMIKKDSTVIYQELANRELSQNRMTYSKNTVLSRVLLNSGIENFKLHLGYLGSYLEPQELFGSWTYNPAYMTGTSGLFYPIDLLFLGTAGAALLMSNLPLLFLAVAGVGSILVPLALRESTPNALSALIIVPIFMVGISYGLMILIRNWRKRRVFPVLVIVIGFFWFYSMSRFLYTFYVSYPKTLEDFPPQYNQAFEYVRNTMPNTSRIVVLDSTFGKNIQLYWQFYERGNPKASTQYEFIADAPQKYDPKLIYIQAADTVPKDAIILFTSLTRNSKFKVEVFKVPEKETHLYSL